jgi:hypothetical protein
MAYLGYPPHQNHPRTSILDSGGSFETCGDWLKPVHRYE